VTEQRKIPKAAIVQVATLMPWEAAKIIDYLWHGNRHTFCSWLAMAGATTKGVQGAAGHKSIPTTARHSHLSPAHRGSVVEKIAMGSN
jgi:site-specific recombinase XerD